MFKVGDKVEIVGDHYTFTTNGMQGIVISTPSANNNENRPRVHSESLVGGTSDFNIRPEHLKLITPTINFYF